jgi:hypothetical protein
MPENRHFWTTDIYERDRMINEGYKYDGSAWVSSQSATDKPVYRLYSPTMQKHLFTADSYEKMFYQARPHGDTKDSILRKQ